MQSCRTAAAVAAHAAPRFRVIRKKNYRKYRKNVFEKPPVSLIHIISLSEYTSHAHDYLHDRSPSHPKGTNVSPFTDTIPIVATMVHAASHLHHRSIYPTWTLCTTEWYAFFAHPKCHNIIDENFTCVTREYNYM